MRTIIIGGSHAGITAAKTLKKIAPEMDVVVLEKTSTVSFVASSINLCLKGELKDLAEGSVDTPEEIRALGIHLVLNATATKLDPAKQTVTYKEYAPAKVEFQTLSYDYLILALGSSQFTLPFHSEKIAEQVLTYKNLAESQRALQKISDAQDITIIGSGYIGVELAEALSTQAKKIRILERMNTLLFRYYDKEPARQISQRMPKNVQLKLDTPVLDINGTAKKLTVVTPLESFKTDLVIYAVNARPNSQLVKDQLDLDADGTVKVNDYLQTSDEKIYAIGDLISVPVAGDERRYVPLVSGAIITGTLAAENIAFGNRRTFKPMQRTTMSVVWGLYIGSTGFTEDQAPYYNLTTIAVEKEFTDHGFNERIGKKLWLKLVFEKNSQQLIGGQLLSEFEETSLINLISMLIEQKSTVQDILEAEYYFSPLLARKSYYLRDLALLALTKF